MLPNTSEIEKRLWNSADHLRSNSNYASNEYFLPMMGIIFLRHAYSRFLNVKDEIFDSLPSRDGETRPPRKEDFSGKGAIYLKPESQFDYLVNLPDEEDRAAAIVHAMESIEKDYETLRGELPKTEYQDLDNEVLGQLLRTFNDPELKKANGDVFGRIYEYFLTEFADLKAHDNGEFFTPISLVQMIVNVIEPDHGKILDPACGSCGMFVQSAHFIEQMQKNPAEELTFYGLEKNPTTIRLGKMNLAVHGLEGKVQKAISYYEDPHEMLGKADFVMANPPFNVDEVDAKKIKEDPRLPFGLPGVNKEKKVSNGNYLWISYFYSYLNELGRAGFVMSSQASSAGKDEAKVRQKLIETGGVDVMMAIRTNFFYTRTVPCELWFLNKDKSEELKDKVLMIDARNVYRELDRTTNDFSPEQLNNLTAMVWLYRGETERFLQLVENYFEMILTEANAVGEPLEEFNEAFEVWEESVTEFMETFEAEELPFSEDWGKVQQVKEEISEEVAVFSDKVAAFDSFWKKANRGNDGLHKVAEEANPLTDKCQHLVKQIGRLYKQCEQFMEFCEDELDARSDGAWNTRTVGRSRNNLDEARKVLAEQLKQVRYFYRQARWLQERFPDAELTHVKGLVKMVDREEIEAQDWSLSPGRLVGVAPVEEDEGFDFEESIANIHRELNSLNLEAEELSKKISKNYEELIL